MVQLSSAKFFIVEVISARADFLVTFFSKVVIRRFQLNSHNDTSNDFRRHKPYSHKDMATEP